MRSRGLEEQGWVPTSCAGETRRAAAWRGVGDTNQISAGCARKHTFVARGARSSRLVEPLGLTEGAKFPAGPLSALLMTGEERWAEPNGRRMLEWREEGAAGQSWMAARAGKGLKNDKDGGKERRVQDARGGVGVGGIQ